MPLNKETRHEYVAIWLDEYNATHRNRVRASVISIAGTVATLLAVIGVNSFMKMPPIVSILDGLVIGIVSVSIYEHLTKEKKR